MSTAGAIDWMPAPAVTVPDGLILTVPVMGPVMAAPALLIEKPVGPVPVRLVPEPVPVELTNVMADAGPTSAAVALIPDAAAAGAAMAVAITGRDHATPATTLRRLKPFCSLFWTDSFNTSDNDAPVVVFSRGGSFKDRQRGSAGRLPGFDYSPERDLRFLRLSCKVGSRSAVCVLRVVRYVRGIRACFPGRSPKIVIRLHWCLDVVAR